MAEAHRKLLTVAIDFGTTLAGYQFSFRQDYESDPTKSFGKEWYSHTGKLVTMQAPNCILFKPNRTFHSFGYDAENDYYKLAQCCEHGKWYYFKNFKMKLYGPNLHREAMLEEEMGKELRAMLVFSEVIKFLKVDCMNDIKNRFSDTEQTDVQWVLTVPAIWPAAAKQFMREAAKKAGIDDNALMIALEPEAASIYCRYLRLERRVDPSGAAVMQTFTPGTRYIVLDAGGGTVDMTVHMINNDHSLKEIRTSNGGPWGSTMVDEEFKQFLIQTLGKQVMETFKKNYMVEYIELLREFELRKREMNTDKMFAIRVPEELRKMAMSCNIKVLANEKQFKGGIAWIHDRLCLDQKITKGFFQTTINKIIKYIGQMSQTEDMENIGNILMVGGFSQSVFVQTAIKAEFKVMKIFIPPEAGDIVLKGAVIYGHNPSLIVERKSRRTYGICSNDIFEEGKHDNTLSYVDSDGVKRCKSCFSKHVEIGQTLRFGVWQDANYYQQSETKVKNQQIRIYASSKKDPKYVTSEDCQCLGNIILPLPAATAGEIRKLLVEMCYGGTELNVRAKNVMDNTIIQSSFDFLY